MPDSPKKDQFSDRLYEVDSWFNSTMYGLWTRFGSAWATYSAVLGRWRVRGLRRLLVEFTSDGLTLAVVFLAVLFKYGLPEVDDSADVWNQGRKVAVTFTDAQGNFVGRRGIHQNDAIPLSEIPPVLIKATLATEDRRFFDHIGVDFQGTTRAMVENVRARDVVQGGSTLTQQLAKNLFLTPERTFERKLNEAFLALWIEARLSKEQILKMYLDRSYMGAGTYGVEAASQFYFNKSVRDVTLPEAAMLAGLFKAPSTYAPHIDLKAAHARANVVLDGMVAAGFISEGEAFAARRNPAVLVERDAYESPDYFLDFAYAEVQELIKQYGLENEFNLTVRTTIDTRLQKLAQATINNMLDVNAKSYKANEAALVSMTPLGAVKAVVGGRDYESSQFNRATDAKRQPGSAFKPFVYLAALRAGLRPDSVLVDRPIHLGNWSPQNYSRDYRGPVTLTTALKKSINTIPIQIAQNIGRKAIIETAELIGLQSKVTGNRSMPLGTDEVTVMDITGAYAGFANGGRRVRPYAVLEIRRPGGETLYDRARNAKEPEQTVNPVYIGDLNYMLNQVVTSGTGTRAMLTTTPVAGKTGTTQDYRDAWFIGFSANYVTGVWIGNDDYSTMNRVTGGRLPAQTWHEFMAAAERGNPPQPLPGVTVSGLYAQAEEEFDTSDELALLEASSSDPVVRVLYNMSGLFRNALAKTVRGQRYDSVAEFRNEPEVEYRRYEPPRSERYYDEREQQRERKRQRPQQEPKTIWNTPVWEGGFR